MDLLKCYAQRRETVEEDMQKRDSEYIWQFSYYDSLFLGIQGEVQLLESVGSLVQPELFL